MTTSTLELATRDGDAVHLPEARLERLRSRVDGPVLRLLRPGEPGWDDAPS